MKEKFKKLMFKYSALCILVLITNAGFAQAEDTYIIEKTWPNKNIKSLNIYTSDVRTRILPSEDNSFKVLLTFEAASDKDGEIDKLKEYLQDVMIQSTDKTLRITNQGAKKATYVNITDKEKAKLVFDNGRVKLKMLDWKLMEVYVPENMDIDLHSYFSKVDFQYPMKGSSLHINSFDSEVKALLYKGDLVINDGQFSKFYFDDLKDVNIKINESDFTTKSVNDLIVDSKFSDIKVDECINLTYTGFEDEFDIGQVKKAKINSNFSELNFKQVEEITGELSEGSLTMQHCNDAVLIGKYSEIEVEYIGLLKLRNCVETEINLQKVNHIYSLYGQFNEFNIDYLEMVFSTYQSTEEEVKIVKTAPNFKGIIITGNFCEASLNLDKNCNYTLTTDVQFSEVELNKNNYEVELYDKEYSSEKMIFHYGNATKKSTINIKGTEMDIEILHGNSSENSNNSQLQPHEYLNGWLLIQQDEKYGFTESNGKEIVSPIYDRIYDFGEYQKHWAKVEVDERFGFINDKGREVVPVIYDEIDDFGEYLTIWAKVRRENAYGFIDNNGREVVAPIYDKICDFGEYLTYWAKIKVGEQYGFINEDGKEVVSPIYDEINDFGEYLTSWALVKRDAHYGFINKEGREIITPQYDKIYDFGEYQNNLAKIEVDGKFGFIDNNGKEVVPPIYDNIEFSNSLVGTKDNEKVEVTYLKQ